MSSPAGARLPATRGSTLAPEGWRSRWVEPAGLFILGLAVRAGVALLHPAPGYPDAAYYIEVARSLASGHGFSVDFLWTFIEVGGRIPANPHLPVPSNPHWAPLASMVQVPFLVVFGTSIWASLAPFILLGALAGPLTWAIAREAGASRGVQLGAGLLGAVPAATTAFIGQADNFALTTLLGGGALWLTTRGLRGDRRAFVLAGLCVGFATLARTDGILLASAPAAAFFWDRWRWWRGGRAGVTREQGGPGVGGASVGVGGASVGVGGSVGTQVEVGGSVGTQVEVDGSTGTRVGTVSGRVRSAPAISWLAAIGCAAAFFVVMGPWWARELAVFGSISPSTNAGVLWLTSFSQLNSVTANRSLAHFLAQPPGQLLASRFFGFVAAVGVYVVIVCGIVLVPFVVIGAWLRRRSVDFGPFFVFAIVLFAISSLLFAIHVPNGMFLHAGVALAPHSYVLAMEGVAASGTWLARRVRGWEPARFVPFLETTVLGLVGVVAVLATLSVAAGWDHQWQLRTEAAQALVRAGARPTDRLMSEDAASFKYLTGMGGIVTVDDPLPVIETTARDYRVRWLVLESDGVVPALRPVLAGAERPSWIGPPVFAEQRAGGSSTAAGRITGLPAIAVYPVCFDAGDPRCAGGG